MERLQANVIGKTRRDRLNGREHIVAPISLIVPGVLNGSQGPLLYPLEEIRKDPTAWNGIPLTLGHPAMGGQHVSARDPDVLNASGMGVVMRAKANGKLTAEAWFDVESTRRVDDRVLNSLENGIPIEVSTGLFTENTDVDNESFEGTSYVAIARNYRPDHLAILPDQKGACSIEDGCGVLVNDDGTTVNGKLFGLTSEVAEHTHSVFLGGDGFGFTSFEQGHSHSVENFKVKSAAGHKHNLNRNNLVDTAINNERGGAMTLNKEEKGAIVDSLVANCDCWNEQDKELLSNFSDEKLELLKRKVEDDKNQELVANAAKQGFEDQQGNNHVFNEKTEKWETKVKEQPVVNKKEEPNKPKMAEEWLAEAPKEIQEDLAFARNEKAKQKLEIINKLIVNLTDDEKPQHVERLQKRSLEELHADLMMLPAPKQAEPIAANYLGAAVSTGNVIDPDDDDILELPVANYEEKSA